MGVFDYVCEGGEVIKFNLLKSIAMIGAKRVKLKWRVYLVVLGFLVIFSACRERLRIDSEKPTPEPIQVVEPDEVKISFRSPFRNIGTTRVYPQTKEQKIRHRLTFSGLRLVLYSLDKTTKEPSKVMYVFDKDVSASQGRLSGKDYRGNTISHEGLALTLSGEHVIKVGDYALHAFATPSKELREATEIGKNYSELLKTFRLDDLFTHYALPYGLYASREPVIITEQEMEKNVGERMEISTPELHPLTALLSATWVPNLEQLKGFVIDKRVVQLKADVMNKKYLLFPKEQSELKALGLYFPEDANYNGFQGKSKTELEDEFLYMPEEKKWNAEVIRHRSRSLEVSDEEFDSYMVIPENTMSANEVNGQTVTRLIVRAYILPKHMENQLPKTISGSYPSWVLYEGKGYSVKEFGDMYKAAKEKGRKANEKEQNIAEAGDELHKFAGGTSNAKTMKYPSEGYDGVRIKYYHNARNYYAIPITHFTAEELGENSKIPGRYGVVRGTHYHLNIQSFGSLGCPTFNSLNRDIDYGKELPISSYSVIFKDFKQIDLNITL